MIFFSPQFFSIRIENLYSFILENELLVLLTVVYLSEEFPKIKIKKINGWK